MKGLLEVFLVLLALSLVSSSIDIDDLGEYDLIDLCYPESTITFYRSYYSVKTFSSCTRFSGRPGIVHDYMLDYHSKSVVGIMMCTILSNSTRL